VRFSGPAFTDGIEEHSVFGASVRVYCVAKTVADLFKCRNKLGRKPAVLALRDALLTGRCSEVQIWHWACVCRVASVVEPYLQVMRRYLGALPIPPPPAHTPYSIPLSIGSDGSPYWGSLP
jgi:hypothetical protein